MKKELKTLDRIPLKGELFIYEAGEIKRLVVDSKNYMITEEQINEELLKNRYLLFTYLGCGLAREKYSSKIFNLIMECDMEDEDLLIKISSYKCNCLNNKEILYNDYKKILKNPLLIHTTVGYRNNKIYRLDDLSMQKLKENIGYEKQIGDLIDNIEIDSKKTLLNQMDEFVNSNENYNLKKTLK